MTVSTAPLTPTSGAIVSNLVEITLSCPLCREPFKSSIPGSSAEMGPLHTDFRREVVGFQTRSHLIHTCPFCGYTASETDFNRPLHRPVARNMMQALRYLVRGDVPLACHRFEYAARCAEMAGENPSKIADLYLSAAWCAQEENQQQEERTYRAKAIEFFERALEVPGLIASTERATTTYLIGELYRRLGKSDDAGQWLERVGREIIDPKGQAWILSLAEQQMKTPQELIELPPPPERA